MRQCITTSEITGRDNQVPELLVFLARKAEGRRQEAEGILFPALCHERTRVRLVGVASRREEKGVRVEAPHQNQWE
jgi:hypothetical protein